MFKKIRSKGFTLIELMVVISIVSTVSSTILVSLSGAKSKGRDGYRVSQIHEVQSALSLYYSKYGVYPPNTYPSSTLGDQVPRNWAEMMRTLVTDGLISATISKADTDSWHFSLIKTVYAVAGYTYYGTSIQDPLYKGPNDFAYSYAYVSSGDRKSYKIRIYIEAANSPLFINSLDGTSFLNSSLTSGDTACDKSLRYYCVGSIL